MFDVRWEIGVLLDSYSQRAAKLDEHDFDGEDNLKNLYAQAIILNVKRGYGIFLPIDDFIEDVRGGFYTDYDGCGDLLDFSGDDLGDVRCNVKYLESAKDSGAVYVAWFNK